MLVNVDVNGASVTLARAETASTAYLSGSLKRFTDTVQ